MSVLFFILTIIAVASGLYFWKKQQKKEGWISFGAAIILFFLFCFIVSSTGKPSLKLDKTNFTTNAEGEVVVRGTIGEDDELVVTGTDDDAIKMKGNKFTVHLLLDDAHKKTFTFKAIKDDKSSEETVTVHPSKAFKKKLAKYERQKEKALNALVLAENKPTRENYDVAYRLIQALGDDDDNSDLYDRLDAVDQLISQKEENEKKLAEATKQLEKAEKTKNRADYKNAEALINDLSEKKDPLLQRLKKLDATITTAEKQAAEAKRQKEAAAAAAKKAQEEAKKQQAAAQAQAQQAAQQQAEAQQNDQNEQTVYIAPQSGTKYHYSSSCRGLNRANSVQAIPLSEAQRLGYQPCGFEN